MRSEPVAVAAEARSDEFPGDAISPISGGRVPQHVAIIMDGNGRWATQRGLPRAAGHRAGTENIRRMVERFDDHGVRFLTLYAFSTENWNRPPAEVQALIRLLGLFIKRELANFQRKNVRLRHFGHLENLPGWLQRQVGNAVASTCGNTGLTLSICFSYGGRDDIVMAARALVAAGLHPGEVTEESFAARLSTAGIPDPDLLIRTAGELRVSNFLLWQCAYAELYFTDAFWPDFGREDIDIALAEYGRRKRKFGGLLADDIDAPARRRA